MAISTRLNRRIPGIWITVALFVATAPLHHAQGSTRPKLPRLAVEDYAGKEGRTIVLKAKSDLQTAINRARGGDTIVLAAGAIYRGGILLPKKTGSEWITIRAGTDAVLPQPGARVGPEHFHRMPKILSKRGPVLKALPGAHHYRFVGIELGPQQGVFIHNVVDLGDSSYPADAVPHHFIFERCRVRGDMKLGARRGIAMNASHVRIVDSHLSDFKEVGADSQAIASWSGPGPFYIENNYLEAAGENVLFGGADPPSRNRIPSDIVVRRNHFSKPVAWKSDEPTYEGTPWTVKNLFELKNARRVLVERNMFEHNWAQAQNGYAILFTVRNQDGNAPWSVVQDVVFRDNVVRQVTAAFNILGHDSSYPSGSRRTERILIQNNLLENIGHERWGGGGTFLQILEGTSDIVVENNTALHTSNIVTAEGTPHKNFVFNNNIVMHNQYGVIGSGQGIGHSSIKTFFPGADFRWNVIVGGKQVSYPKNNFFPPTIEASGLLIATKHGRGEGDMKLPYRQVLKSGIKVGADVSRLKDALNSVQE